MSAPIKPHHRTRFMTTGVPLLLVSLLLVGCGGSTASATGGNGGGGNQTPQAATPVITTAAAQNGGQVVSLSASTLNSTMYYTTDGSLPTTSSPQYIAPFLLASNVTLNAMAIFAGDTNSKVASQNFAPNIPSGTLVWSDEFTNATTSNAAPNPAVWTYDTGAGGWGNAELEDYCSAGSTASPCSTSSPNAYRYRWLSAHRRATTVRRRLHLRPA